MSLQIRNRTLSCSRPPLTGLSWQISWKTHNPPFSLNFTSTHTPILSLEIKNKTLTSQQLPWSTRIYLPPNPSSSNNQTSKNNTSLFLKILKFKHNKPTSTFLEIFPPIYNTHFNKISKRNLYLVKLLLSNRILNIPLH